MSLLCLLHISPSLILLHNKINYPQKLWISWGLTNLKSNSQSRLEVNWLFFAQGDYVTYSRYRTKGIVNMKGDKTGDAIVRRTLSTRQSSRAPLS
jgi:hypothetical protein